MDVLTIADWSGSVAAAISIVCLFRKSLAYWYWSIAATTLWFYVFLETESAMVAGLQLSYTLFALYGVARWALQARGLHVPLWLEHAGAAIAVAIFGATVALTDFAGWAAYVEFAAVALSIVANWLTALKIIGCWPVWISTNVLFVLLFWHLGLNGLFAMQFVYAALSIVGWRSWHAERAAQSRPALA